MGRLLPAAHGMDGLVAVRGPFVPCRKGISHNPAEYSEPSQLAAGTRVLTQTLTELAGA